MSHNLTPNSNNGASNNGSSPLSRREMRASNVTGALPALGSVPGGERGERGYSGTYDFEHLIESLRDLFAQDRQVASQPDATRCGICYLYFKVDELHYREEGFYVCSNCEQHLGNTYLPMLRKQQRMGM